MKTSKLLVSLFSIVLLISTVAIAQPHMTLNNAADKSDGKVRLVAHTDKEVSNALAAGCTIARKARTLTAVACPAGKVASLGLAEDIRVFAVDTNANSQINADDVQAGGNTGAGRIIAVLDTGVDYNHVQLADSMILGVDFVDDDNNPMDLNGHGTHVAGIITANSGQSKGVAPDASVLAVRVLDANGGGFFTDVVAAIYWVVDNSGYQVDAISMSLGTSPPYTYKGFCNNVLPDMTAAIKYARDRNILVTVAAGNSGGSGVSIPGCISYSTTIGAVDKSDKVASFSGKGNALDLTAPGVGIYSTWLNGGFATASGTSMATPVVAGVAALVKSAHPLYTDEQVEQALIKTAKDLGKRGFDTSYGWGRVDALAAAGYIA